VGYAGGTTSHPTYHDLGDHSESFQVDYDPKVMSFARLLEEFWSCPNPCGQSGLRQYQSIIFYHNEEQKRLALASQVREARRRPEAFDTPILPVGEFTLAEDYHQKFYLRQYPKVEKELAAFYPDSLAWINSTAAMKLNAYFAGHGTWNVLEKEIDRLGLSAAGRKAVLNFMGP
jgi:peptide methionine sulfoxide reductase MsrA